MKAAPRLVKSFIIIALTLGILSGLMVGVYAFDVKAQVAGQIVWVKGNVTATDVNNQSRPLKRGDAVNEQDTIETDHSGSGQIVFPDGGSMAIEPDSNMRVEQFVYTKGKDPSKDRSVIEVVKGGMRAVTGAVSKSSPEAYQVRTPVATIGVRGTDFTIHYKKCTDAEKDNDCGLSSEINKGSIIISNGGGDVIITQGTGPQYAVVKSSSGAPESTTQAPSGLTQITLEPASFGGSSLGPPSGGAGGGTTGTGSSTSGTSTGGTSSMPSAPAQAVSGFCIQ